MYEYLQVLSVGLLSSLVDVSPRFSAMIFLVSIAVRLSYLVLGLGILGP